MDVRSKHRSLRTSQLPTGAWRVQHFEIVGWSSLYGEAEVLIPSEISARIEHFASRCFLEITCMISERQVQGEMSAPVSKYEESTCLFWEMACQVRSSRTASISPLAQQLSAALTTR